MMAYAADATAIHAVVSLKSRMVFLSHSADCPEKEVTKTTKEATEIQALCSMLHAL